MSDTEKFVCKLQECAHNREPITLFGVDYAPMDDIGLLETIIAGIDEENAKLRELVRDYDKVLDAAVDVWGIMADALGYGRKYDALHDRMRELGIEVEA